VQSPPPKENGFVSHATVRQCYESGSDKMNPPSHGEWKDYMTSPVSEVSCCDEALHVCSHQ
ncbi:hypothetical protein KI387_009068, partial [Taxus chinensis]